MVKKLTRVILLILVLYFILLKLFLSIIDHRSTFHIDELIRYYHQLNSNYYFVKDAKTRNSAN